MSLDRQDIHVNTRNVRVFVNIYIN